MDKEESQNNDMSMEDILSSIKGILSDNEKQVSAQTEQTSSKEESIYDLSASMIVDEHKSPEETENNDIEEAEFSIDDIAQSPEEVRQSEELPEITLPTQSIKTDVDSDPIFDEEEDSRHIAEISSLTGGEGAKEESPISEEALDELIQSIDEDNNDEVLAKELPNGEISSVEAILSEMDVPEEKQAVFQEKSIEESVENKEELSSKEQDIPEEIIDNFAAMFDSNNSGASAVAEVNKNKKIGDGAQTVEDLIKAVLRESLKPSIEDAMTKIDADMLVEAKAAVEVEAKAWVDKNLTRVVEEIVREEVRRVMAKVGS